jgi:peroxiredoxin
LLRLLLKDAFMVSRIAALALALSAVVGPGVAMANPEKPTLGTAIGDFQLPDHLGQDHSLAELANGKVVAVAFLGTECPLAKLYAGRLQRIADEYADRDVAVVGVMSNVQDSLAEIAAYVRRHELKFPVLKDRRNDVADMFGAERTPQVFLLDREHVVRYCGRIDDQYVVGVVRDKPTSEDLRRALDQVLAGEAVATPTTAALGCIIGRVREPNAASPVTYARDIAPILQERCVECHRAGEIGPFELTSYEEAAGWGEMMAEVVRERRMPPWHAAPEHGTFANDRSMPAAEKDLIFEWVENGCPEGDPADAPAPRRFTSGWQLPRDPDLVLAMETPFDVPAEAGRRGVPYQYFTVPTGFTEDKWVEAAEVQPGNPSVVHHVIAYASPGGSRRRNNWIFLSAYVPGLRFDGLPAHSAKRIPAGSVVFFEVHYTPNGSPQQDVTKIGLLFADVDDVNQEVVTTEIGNVQFEIPPGDANHVVTATSQPTKQDLTLISLSPHMHLRGKAFRYELVSPDGTREVLLDVPAYDFSWQTRYVLAEPRTIPAGSMIFCRAAFDNSERNLANPDPTATVRWGDQSWDEMMLGYFDVVLPRDDTREAGTKMVTTGLDLVGLFDAADRDHNAGLNAEEMESANKQMAEHFAEIDRDGDQLVQLGELATALRAFGRGR